jgi:hypothetical protein
MSSIPPTSRAEIVMDCIAVADLALLVICTLVFIIGSPELPFGGVRDADCAAACAHGSPALGEGDDPRLQLVARGAAHG